MPFKSEAQRRKFAELLKQGKITRQVFDEWNSETGHSKLPDRVKQKSGPTKPKSLLKRRHSAI